MATQAPSVTLGVAVIEGVAVSGGGGEARGGELAGGWGGGVTGGDDLGEVAGGLEGGLQRGRGGQLRVKP
jgi:hypothetical protein